MPIVTPLWLAGIEDPDKSVSRAAQESFNGVFPTNEKTQGVWRMYHTAILEHLLDLVTKENENTLSDERTTSPEDAIMKYARTVGCGVVIVTKLLSTILLDSAGIYAEIGQRLYNHLIMRDPGRAGRLYFQRKVFGSLPAIVTHSCVAQYTVFLSIA